MTEKEETPENDSADEISHAFDQTNGLVEGLEGDADDPEVFEKAEETALPAVEGVVPGLTAQL